VAGADVSVRWRWAVEVWSSLRERAWDAAEGGLGRGGSGGAGTCEGSPRVCYRGHVGGWGTDASTPDLARYGGGQDYDTVVRCGNLGDEGACWVGGGVGVRWMSCTGHGGTQEGGDDAGETGRGQEGTRGGVVVGEGLGSGWWNFLEGAAGGARGGRGAERGAVRMQGCRLVWVFMRGGRETWASDGWGIAFGGGQLSRGGGQGDMGGGAVGGVGRGGVGGLRLGRRQMRRESGVFPSHPGLVGVGVDGERGGWR